MRENLAGKRSSAPPRSRGTPRAGRCPRHRPAGDASADLRPSATGARRGAESDSRRSVRRGPIRRFAPPRRAGSAPRRSCRPGDHGAARPRSAAGSGRRTRSRGCRRRPILMSCPKTAMRPPPRYAWICRLIEWNVGLIAARIEVLARRCSGCSSPRKPPAGLAVAGDRARLDQRRAFPVLPGALVIAQRRVDRHATSGVERGSGPQPQIGAKNVAIPGCARRECAPVPRGKTVEKAVKRSSRASPGAARAGS